MFFGLRFTSKRTMSTVLEHSIENRRQSSFSGPFVLYWRFRPTHPWNLERYSERSKAYNRFFNLLERGIEARFETARESTTSSPAAVDRAIPLDENLGKTASSIERVTCN